MKTMLAWTAALLLCSMGWMMTGVFLGIAWMAVATAFL